MDFLKHPTELYLSRWPLLTRYSNGQLAFDRGRMAMALELVTIYRTIDRILLNGVGGDFAGASQTMSIVETLLIDRGLWDDANRVYDELCEWRRLRFAAAPQQRASDASAHDSSLLPPLGSDASPLQGRRSSVPLGPAATSNESEVEGESTE